MSTLMPCRLITALAFGTSPVLGEKLEWLSVIGAVLVIVAVGGYLILQYRLQKRSTQKPETTAFAFQM